MFTLPKGFIRNVIEVHEEEGRIWLEHLPTILTECEQRWRLTLDPPFPHLSFHYVAPATLPGGEHAILKVHTPTGEFEQEKEALRLFAGHGMARLLDYDEGNAVLLLERLEPGTLLRTVEDDEKATSIAATVMRQLWRPVPSKHPFPSVMDWGKGFARLRQHYGGGSGPFPTALLEEAETLFAELCASMGTPMLLHGDLHHDNILAAQREPWLAIDPKGLVGEQAYETGALLRNPSPELLLTPQPGRILARRIDQLAEELGLDRTRIRNWGLAQAVLSEWWWIEDVGHLSNSELAYAELLAAIKV